MANTMQIGNPSASAPPPVALACIECRSRHIKCDAKTPTCSRCKSEERQCQYVQSRRGYRGPRKRRAVSGLDDVPEKQLVWENNTREINAMSFEQFNSASIDQPACKGSAPSNAKSLAPQLLPLESTTPFSEAVYDHDIFLNPADDFAWPLTFPSHDQTAGTCKLIDSIENELLFPSNNDSGIEAYAYKNLLNLYYQHFHESHPILLPKRFLFKYLFEQYPSHLKQMMQFIGSHYDSNVSADDRQLKLDLEISIESSKSGYLVQTLLLYAIILHARDEQERAKQKIDAAIEMAIDLGMHLERFAAENGCGSRYLEECWRKTWWELYIVDGLLKLHTQRPFRPWNIELGVLLPVDERPSSDAIVSALAQRSSPLAHFGFSGTTSFPYLELLSGKSICRGGHRIFILCLQD